MISVVMPAYNAQAYIAETLDSILAQTMRDFEIIVVDDGSSDDTVAIVKNYIAKDARIRLIQNEHGRQSKARNTAIEVAQYKWIAPVDADDILLPTRFEKQLQAAEKQPDVVAWATYSQHITSDGRRYSIRHDPPTTIEEFEAMQAEGKLVIVPNSSCLLRKDVVEAIGGYDSRYDSLEDVEILIRMAEHGPILVVPEVLMLYRMHFSSTTGAFESFCWQRSLFKFLEKRAKLCLEGKDLTLDDYLEQYDEVTGIPALVRQLDDWSAFQCKMAALSYGEKRIGKLLQFTFASLLTNPYYVTTRFVNRFILRDQLNTSRV